MISSTNMLATDIRKTLPVEVLISNLTKLFCLVLGADAGNMKVIKRDNALKRAHRGQLFKAIVNRQIPFVQKYYDYESNFLHVLRTLEQLRSTSALKE